MPKKVYSYVPCNWCAEAKAQGRNYICNSCTDGKVINPLEILCNMCGECMCPIGTVNEQAPHGLVDARVVGGYESYHLLDMNCYEFNFCEKCLRQMFIQCKIKPYVHDVWEHPTDGVTPVVDTASEYSFEQDQASYEYRVWVDDGSHHNAYLNKTCNRVKDCPNKALYTVMLSDEFTEECVCDEHKDSWKNTINAELVKFIPNSCKVLL